MHKPATLPAEGQGRANEQLFRAVFDGAMDAMLIADHSGCYVDANPAATLLFGLSRERLLGRYFGDLLDPTLGSAENWAQFLRDGVMEGRFRLSRPDGSERDIDFRATANILPGLNLSVLRDVTERRQSERMLEDTQSIAHLGSWASGASHSEPITWSAECARIFGREIADAPTLVSFIDAVHPADRGRVVAAREGAKETGGFLETEHRIVLPTGEVRWVYARSVMQDTVAEPSDTPRVALHRISAQFCARGVIQDITERKHAEDALRASDETRNRLASIVASSDDAIISQGVDGLILTWNRGAEKLTQYSAEEAVGQPITMLYPPEQMSRLGDLHQRVDDGQRLQQFEMVCLRKDGTYVDVAITSSVLIDDQGEVHGVSIIARDITERLRSEAALHRADEQLRHAQKMEAIGSLAGGVAHDFNNLLSVILSYTSLMVDELKPADPLRADIEEVHKAGLRATVLTSQLLAFSRHQMLQPIVLDLNRIVSELEKMLGRLLREDIQLTLLPAPSAGNVYADAGQIEQVITNLVVNARDAMPNGGSLTIETAFVVLGESYVAAHVGVPAGPYISLAVTDTGTGMDAATLGRIFEPFFTTKDSSKGTGLGLSTVYGIIQQSGGHIDVDSEVGKGTTFTIYLPRTDRVMESELRAVIPLSTLRGTETILLVEDEEQVLAVMRAILRKHGYKVLEARNGGEAFLVCEQFPGGIDLLLTDVVMPRMSGRQVAERLLRLRPAMKVLYVSGYTDDAIVHHGVLAAGVAFLQKPVLPGTLLEKIRQLLDASSPVSVVPLEA